MYRLLRGVSTKKSCEQVEQLPSAGRAAPTAKAQKKICWDFVHALFELAIWLQAGEDRAMHCGGQPSRFKNGLSAPISSAGEFAIRETMPRGHAMPPDAGVRAGVVRRAASPHAARCARAQPD
jgi:hypothetical protein